LAARLGQKSGVKWRVPATGNQLNVLIGRRGEFGSLVRCSWEKGMVGASAPFCGRAVFEGEERRGGGGLVRAAPCRWRTAWGAWRPARGMTGGGERGLEKCEQGRRGWRAWAVREGVGQPGKGGSWAGPERTVAI
jgi:hypothetical protein